MGRSAAGGGNKLNQGFWSGGSGPVVQAQIDDDGVKGPSSVLEEPLELRDAAGRRPGAAGEGIVTHNG